MKKRDLQKLITRLIEEVEENAIANYIDELIEKFEVGASEVQDIIDVLDEKPKLTDRQQERYDALIEKKDLLDEATQALEALRDAFAEITDIRERLENLMDGG